MRNAKKLLAGVLMALTAGLLGIAGAYAAGSVEPSPIDTTGLERLGEEWRPTNPYVGNEKAIKIGASGYAQNCARCHGIDAISGGIAPDLRYLPPDAEGDEWFSTRVRTGAVRDGRVYMPPFGEVLGQEALWAIRSWLVTRYTED